MTSPLRSDPAALSLHFVSLGTHNKGYTVRGSARLSLKFFFRYALEKLRISLTLCRNSAPLHSNTMLGAIATVVLRGAPHN